MNSSSLNRNQLKETTKRALEDLIEKARKLQELKLDEHIRRRGFGFRAHRVEGDDWEIEFDLPDEKERDASLLTFRLFIQRNERYSFHGLRRLADDPALSEE